MHVEGYVIATLTGDTIQDAWVTLRRTKEDNGWSYEDFPFELDSMKVGDDGFYQFDFQAERNVYYAVTAVHPHYYSKARAMDGFGWYATTIGSRYQKDVNLDIKLIPFTYLKVHIRNVPPNYSSDSIHYRSTTDYSSGYESKNMVHWINASSADFDTTLLITFQTGLVGTHYWDLYSNGVLDSENGAYLSCYAHDTCEYNVFY